MSFAHKYSTVLILILFQSVCFGQSNKKAQLEKEQKQIESRIQNTKKLLSKTENDLKNRTIELRLIEKNLQLREQLVRNIDHQIRSTEQRIAELESTIKELDKQTLVLKEQYKSMVIYAYKNRSTMDRLMFVLSSENFNEANKRAAYLQKINEVRQKQVQLIRSNQERLAQERKELENQKLKALQLAEQKKQERETLMQDKIKQQEVFNAVKQEESSLRAKLIEDEKNKLRVQKEIKIAIDKEIQEEIKRKKEEEKLKEIAKQKNNAGKPIPESPKDPEKSETRINEFGVTPEAKLAGNTFASNKGKLPYPVSIGSVVEKFGRNSHPTIPNVYTENNGVDISTPRSSEVRAVYEGEVSSIISIPGAGKAIILSHGNYRTVYANMQDTYVSKGTKINHKQILGSLLPQGNISVLHFEIHVISDNGVQKLNPELWLSR